MIAPVCWRSFVGSRVLIAGLGFFVSIGIAQAQPDLSPLQRPSRPMIEAAQQHYLSGTRFFEQSQWDAALVEFSASFQLSGERDLLQSGSRKEQDRQDSRSDCWREVERWHWEASAVWPERG